MTHVEIVPIEPWHIEAVNKNLRDFERNNIAMLGVSSARLIQNEVKTSMIAYAGLADGIVVTLWGARYTDILSDEAYLWALFSEHLQHVPITMLRHSREALRLLTSNFTRCYGYVQADFELSKRWLRWLGFTIDPPESGFCKARIGRWA